MITSEKQAYNNSLLLRNILMEDYVLLKIDIKSFINGMMICNMLIYNNNNIIKYDKSR